MEMMAADSMMTEAHQEPIMSEDCRGQVAKEPGVI